MIECSSLSPLLGGWESMSSGVRVQSYHVGRNNTLTRVLPLQCCSRSAVLKKTVEYPVGEAQSLPCRSNGSGDRDVATCIYLRIF